MQLSLHLHGDGLRVMVGDADGVDHQGGISLPSGDYSLWATCEDGELVMLWLDGPVIDGPLSERQFPLPVNHGDFMVFLDNAQSWPQSTFAEAREALVHAPIGSDRCAAIVSTRGPARATFVAGPLAAGWSDLWLVSYRSGGQRATTVLITPND